MKNLCRVLLLDLCAEIACLCLHSAIRQMVSLEILLASVQYFTSMRVCTMYAVVAAWYSPVHYWW